MRYFCTYFDSNYLSRGLALHESLTRQVPDFELNVLCMDAGAARGLRERKLPRIRVVELAALTAAHPELAAAAANRSQLEFYFTCTPWLVHHLLPGVPRGEFLTYLDADLYFFAGPEPVFDELRAASVGIIAHGFPPSLELLARYGRYNVGWVSFRHDDSGTACALDWARRCAEWCYNHPDRDRYADQKYLDAWASRFSGVVEIRHPGANVAPWNVKGRAFTADRDGILVDGQRLVFYHFHALRHVGGNLYETGLHRYDAHVTPGLRDLVYVPYLERLAGDLTAEERKQPPALIPVAAAGDARAIAAGDRLFDQLRACELDRCERLAAIERMQAELEEHGMKRHEAEARVRDLEPSLRGTQAYVQKIEVDRELRLQAITQLQARIRELEGRLGLSQVGQVPAQPGPLPALPAFFPHLRAAVVPRYHERLLRPLLQLATSTVSTDVFSAPPELAGRSMATLRFHGESIWESLARRDSLFNEQAYLEAFPDIAGAVAQGHLRSGWEHFVQFGQHEVRTSSVTYTPGLGEYDAILGDVADFPGLLDCLAGRLQPHHAVMIAGLDPRAE
ncbi:MAG TPA: hypothetical protein PLB90_16810, partial [Opitutaceae bacterium]|nr:hypothetical protein [Opitutaceae bacterium]